MSDDRTAALEEFALAVDASLLVAWGHKTDEPGAPPFHRLYRIEEARQRLVDIGCLEPIGASDSDGPRSAETACPAPVPQDGQARAEGIAQRRSHE